MTKRTLLIIIALLVVIDVIAAFWYLSVRIENSGESRDLFEQRDSSEVTIADTLAEDIADKFIDRSMVAYFVSSKPAVAGNMMSYYTCVKQVKTRWPKSINGNQELADLQEALVGEAFGNSHKTLQEARSAYLSSPDFNKPIDGGYKTINQKPNLYQGYARVCQVLIFPHMTSRHLLTMQIDQVEFNGYNTSRTSSYVHYDRIKHRVLNRLDLLTADRDNQLLALINSKIDELNTHRNEAKQLRHAMSIASHLCCTKQGIYFEYPSEELAIADNSQAIDILIPYDKLQPYMTDALRQIVAVNGGYWVYKKLEAEPVKLTATKGKSSFTAKRTMVKRHSGAKRKAARRGYGGQHYWKHRQR